MRILIVEDELTVAKRLMRLLDDIDRLEDLTIKHVLTLDDADDYIENHVIDILFLDLNLNNKDGFELLKKSLAGSFHTIVVSANTQRALEAFEYGVLDFIAKPFNKSRIEKALSRISTTAGADHSTERTIKYLTVRHLDQLEVIKLSEVAYIKGASNYSELHLLNGRVRMHSKSLNKMLDLLPESFERVHKSYIVPVNRIDKLHTSGNGNYTLILTDQTEIPISRNKVKQFKEL